MKKPQILLVNDDGISSPGLWAAAKELSSLGYVTVAAPREQHSGAGRSVPAWSDGEIKPTLLKIGDQEWTCYAVGGSPAQSVQYGIFCILKVKPDLIVSGINYGENPAIDITLSGTVGAALEGASYGIPSLAVSIQLENEDYLGYSDQVDFSTAAIFTRRFAKILLEKQMPPDVMALNVNVPSRATPETPWRVTRLGRHSYFVPYLKEPVRPGEPPRLDARPMPHPDDMADVTTDVRAFKVEHIVSVTPLSLDLTSRVDLNDLQTLFGKLD
ncbi:MAG: 5'-nucleotidase [Chloroflexi bacterium]|nr:MAG: 5'-nucleotidase [Chloroflexota bacterium]MBA4374853.1 5'/3'-nucleotidase SurE [Anaerolinea sp.]